MASLASEWRLTIVMLIYLLLYFIVVNLMPDMAEYAAAIGVVLGILTWVKYHNRCMKAIRMKDVQTRKDYRKVVIWILFYLIAISALYFLHYNK